MVAMAMMMRMMLTMMYAPGGDDGGHGSPGKPLLPALPHHRLVFTIIIMIITTIIITVWYINIRLANGQIGIVRDREPGSSTIATIITLIIIITTV